MRAPAWFAAAALPLATGPAPRSSAAPAARRPPTSSEDGGIPAPGSVRPRAAPERGTSKGGSAGHLALAIRDGAPGDDLVWSANFYADRDPKHARDFHTRRPHARDPEEGVPLRDGLLAGPQRLVRPRLRRGLQALGHRHPRLRRPARAQGGPGRLLPPHQRRLPRPRAGHGVPPRRGDVRLPAPELRQDHRLGVPVRRALRGAGGEEPVALHQRPAAGGPERQHPHRDGR